MNFEAFCVLTLLALLFGGGAWVGVQFERYETRRKTQAGLQTAALVHTAERLTYLQRLNLAKNCIEEPDGPVAQALIVSLKSENESFYARDWTVEEAQRHLRLLAKDYEMAEATPVPRKLHIGLCDMSRLDRERCSACREKAEIHETHTQAVSLEFVDSIGDLERKAQYLFSIIMRLDFNALVFSMSEQGMSKLAEKFRMGTQIKRDLQELYAATLTNLQITVERLRLEADSMRSQLDIANLQSQLDVQPMRTQLNAATLEFELEQAREKLGSPSIEKAAAELREKREEYNRVLPELKGQEKSTLRQIYKDQVDQIKEKYEK